MDAASFFRWNRAADILAPLLFKSLGNDGRSSIISVEIRQFEGANTIAVLTPEGTALILGYDEGWIRVFDGTRQRKGEFGKKHLMERTKVTVSFTEKGVEDITALVYGWEKPVG